MLGSLFLQPDSSSTGAAALSILRDTTRVFVLNSTHSDDLFQVCRWSLLALLVTF